jgi:predicted AAA+ superfamily ATPase
VKIVRLAEENWETNEKALETLLMHPEVVDRKLVVVSIVGVVATGKTTFMDYCLRFMYANVSQI